MVEPKRVFVTGGTGLIGRRAVEAMIDRGAEVTLMLRSSDSAVREERLSALEARAAAADTTLRRVSGDLSSAGLGLDEAGLDALRTATDVLHAAALYDLSASDDEIAAANDLGTGHLIQALRTASFPGTLHHVSSIAVAGDFKGTFTEAMFDEGQRLKHAYHRSKHSAEKRVRESGLPHRIYRPSSVVGDSKTGEMDKVDGIYFGFESLRWLARNVPAWVRLPVPKVRGRFNVVPVDFVAAALVHIALADEVEGTVFHLVDPKPPRVEKLAAALLRAGGGPRLGPALDPSLLGGALSIARGLPSVKELVRGFQEDGGVPRGAMEAMNLRVRFDASNTEKALEGSNIRCPRFEDYARPILRYYEDHLDPRSLRPGRYRAALTGKVVLVTGASRGIGAAVARQAAAAGAVVILVARGAEALELVAQQIREEGGEAYVRVTDLSDFAAIDALVESVLAEFEGIDVLINNAARSIRRPISDALDRFHDYERTMGLNYFTPVRLTLGFLPSLRERGGHISNVLSMGVLIPGPYFSAYLASKAALDSFGDSLAAELSHEDLCVSAIYLPLVATEMMAPTEAYKNRNDVMTPPEAAELVLDAVVDRRRRQMPGPAPFYAFANRFSAGSTTRILNLLSRIFPAGDAESEFPMEKAFITKAIGGSPV